MTVYGALISADNSAMVSAIEGIIEVAYHIRITHGPWMENLKDSSLCWLSIIILSVPTFHLWL